MKKPLKTLIIAVVAIAVVVVAVSFIYAKFWNKADDEFNTGDVKDLLTATTTVTPDAPVTTGGAAPETTVTPVAADGVEGNWAIAEGSEVGYRVDESINGFDTTANGRTQAISGTFTIGATSVTAGSFTVDMTTFKSDESRRDGQFNGRIMDVATFPTATFVLTAPIDFKQVPTDGGTLPATATGDLTLHGITKSVTFEVEATFLNGRVGVLGQIPVLFADFGIPNPSVATITSKDNGLLEFVLAFDRA
ncbi:MAG TPA: YceI family protein [Ilumatobacteraceae bacterium]|nr:YceI family protein [Ilumatobacteraceae bacterium]HRB02010.1 YceI family protein [Ilumatobacteraceae bacterium]